MPIFAHHEAAHLHSHRFEDWSFTKYLTYYLFISKCGAMGWTICACCSYLFLSYLSRHLLITYYDWKSDELAYLGFLEILGNE